MKLKYKRSKQRHLVFCTVDKKEGINRKELDILYEPPEGLLRVTDYNPDKLSITYEANLCIPMPIYYKQKCFTGDEILGIIKRLIVILGNLDDQRLTHQKLVLDFNYTFYNINEKMPQLIFCPIQNNYKPLESNTLISFLKDIVNKAVIVRGSSRGYDSIDDFLSFLSQNPDLTESKLCRYFDENPEKKVSTKKRLDIPKPSESHYPSEDYSRKNPASPQKSKSSVQPKSIAAAHVHHPSVNTQTHTPVLVKQIPVSEKPQVKSSATKYVNEKIAKSSTSKKLTLPNDTVDINDMENSSGKVQLPGDTIEDEIHAYLKNEATGELHDVSSGYCIVGREGVDINGDVYRPDVVISKNLRIGKRHALVMCIGSDFYIADLASKNKTRVNGEIVESGLDLETGELNGKRARLENKDRVQFANESFIFLLVDEDPI